MRPAKLSVGPVLWLAGWCLLAAGLPAEQPCSPQSGSENCPPHPTKSATLVPSFTETPKPTTTAPQKHTTTHHHHRHTTTAPANHTTTQHVTTTTKKPTTTTHHTATTTKKPTTTTHHTATTTKKPTTTTHHATTAPANHTSTIHPTSHRHTTAHAKPTIAPTAPANHTSAAHPTTTTTPQPTQPPAVPVGNYTVKQGARVCLRADMGLQLRIRYTDKAKKQQVWGAFAVQPNHTNVSGTCSNKTATLKLQFPEGFVLFTFQKNETEKAAYLSQVQANLTYQFPQATEKSFWAKAASLREFAAPLGKSYQCRNRSLALSETVHLTALSERLQAFQLQDGKFGEAEVCPEQKRSVVLPIVVGVVLGLLILIVLVAFAVGRWRSRTGYESL